MHKHALIECTCYFRTIFPRFVHLGARERRAVVLGMAVPSKGATRTSLISRTLKRCKSGLNRIGAAGAGWARPPPPVAGYFPVFVGPERVRFVVRAEHASHPLFRRLLEDAEREYGYVARGPLALPCDVDAFLDVLWHMEHGDDGGGDEGDGHCDGEIPTAVSTPPICGLRSSSKKGRAAGYRMMDPRSSPVIARIGELRETKHARTRSYS